MTTLTFKVSDQEARFLRLAAQRERLSLSEFLRRRLGSVLPTAPSVKVVRCPTTGAMIFSPESPASPLTTSVVREILADFP